MGDTTYVCQSTQNKYCAGICQADVLAQTGDNATSSCLADTKQVDEYFTLSGFCKTCRLVALPSCKLLPVSSSRHIGKKIQVLGIRDKCLE